MYVEMKNIFKQYGNFRASDNVNFGIEKGKLVALLGPSGSGKTTILRMIAGLETPSFGDIYIDGKRVNDVPANQREIGFVFQNYALFRHMTVYDNIAFGLKLKKVPKDEIKKRVTELLDITGLAGLEKRYPNQLSGGQRQRVAFARALAPKSILVGDKDSQSAQEGQPVTIQLDKEVDVSRGCVLSSGTTLPVSKSLTATILWMDDAELTVGKDYIVKIGTKQVLGVLKNIQYKIDVNTGNFLPANGLSKNEIAVCDIGLQEAVVIDEFAKHKTLGELILIDRISQIGRSPTVPEARGFWNLHGVRIFSHPPAYEQCVSTPS